MSWYVSADCPLRRGSPSLVALIVRPARAGGSAGGLRRALVALLAAVLFSAGVGCTPRHYRMQADAESYGILSEKTQHPRWWVPPFSVEPPPESRNFDPYDPERSPLPPDDPVAHQYMHRADGHRGYARWHQNGDACGVTAPHWLGYLEFTQEGQLALDPDRAVELGLANSREYQFELEDLYLAALNLSLERFEFQLQWFGGNTTFYEFVGNQISARSPPEESNALTTSSDLGFRRALTTGGQLLVDFANTFVWEFTGPDTTATLSTISVSLVQPLLRGAFKDVRMELLTQSERDVLYAARDYARFRKQFYFDLVSGNDGYLSLLLQLQGIRNLEANLVSLEQSLRTHEALARAGVVSPLQVDQVFQSYQSGRLRLIRARNNLQTSLDQYKIRLGLPPEFDVQLDDSLLAPFELNSPQIVQLQLETEELLKSFRELDQAPPAETLATGLAQLLMLHDEISRELDSVFEEWQHWAATDLQTAPSEAEYEQREDEFRRTLELRLQELRRDMNERREGLEAAAAEPAPAAEAWQRIQRLARRVSGQAADLFVVQSQIRAYLIQLEPAAFQGEEAVEYGLVNRLDLMNRQAQVVDAWRRVRVAADALESELDVNADAVIGTTPGTSNPLRFSSDASRFRVGLRFDAPLNRRIERNIYRAELIEYQRSRRRWIGSRDDVVQSVRLDLRELEAERLNFEIARQSLIAAARQVELARIQLLAPNQAGDSSTTQDALDALDSLLDAKNALIAVWVAYETNRLQLLLDTEALQLDERGLYQDDHASEFNHAEPLPAPGPDPT